MHSSHTIKFIGVGSIKWILLTIRLTSLKLSGFILHSKNYNTAQATADVNSLHKLLIWNIYSDKQRQYLHVSTVWHNDGLFIYWTALVARKSDFHAWNPWNLSHWTVSFTCGKGHLSRDFLTFCVIGHASFPSRKYDFPKVYTFS